MGTTDKAYLLDSSAFIQAKRAYYAFDICPGFWDVILDHEILTSIDHVKREIEHGKDDLTDWVKTKLPSERFASSDQQPIAESYRKVMGWVNQQSRFTDAAKADFASKADGWLVAHAMNTSVVVVTQEVSAREAKKKVPIPDVCDAFKIPYLNTFEMLRELEASFDWSRNGNSEKG